MTEKEKTLIALEYVAEYCDIDPEFSDSTERMLEMTFEEYLKHKIEDYYRMLMETPKTMLGTKMSDLFKNYLCK